MSRKPRFQLPGVPQHVVQRGNNRQACFFAEGDYLYYLESLRAAADKFGGRIHAHVLMTNHVHLLMTPDRENALSEVMQSVGRRYVRYVNRECRRSGPLWEGRFKASLVQSERYLLSASNSSRCGRGWSITRASIADRVMAPMPGVRSTKRSACTTSTDAWARQEANGKIS